MTYGRSPIEVIGLALSAIGLLLLMLLIRRPEPEGIVPWEMLGDRDDAPASERARTRSSRRPSASSTAGRRPGRRRARSTRELEPVPAGAEAPPP